jgi:hypothetical protein
MIEAVFLAPWAATMGDGLATYCLEEKNNGLREGWDGWFSVLIVTFLGFHRSVAVRGLR